jgi:hypothetical protein
MKSGQGWKGREGKGRAVKGRTGKGRSFGIFGHEWKY